MKKTTIASWLMAPLLALVMAAPLAAQPGGKLVLYTSQPDRDALDYWATGLEPV